MTYFSRLLVTVTLSFPLLASGQSPCQLPPEGPVTRVLFKSAENCAFAEDLAHLLTQLRQQIPQAPPVSLVISAESTNASFDNGHIIWLPQVLVSADPYGNKQTSQPSQLLQVVVHEYGHAILNVALKKHFTKELGNLYEAFEAISTEAEQNLIEKITSRGVRQRGGELAQTEEFKLYFQHIPAYSELYADTLTVYAFDDLAAMKKALSFARQNKKKSLQIQLRDFTQDHSLEEIEKSHAVHSHLSLVRSYIGKKWKTLNSDGKRRLLFSLENAIIRALQENLKRTAPPSLQEMNQQLIRLMENEL